MRRAQNADTYAVKQHWLSQIVPPSDMHLEPESEKREKNVDFHTAKNVQKQANFFAIFRRVLKP